MILSTYVQVDKMEDDFYIKGYYFVCQSQTDISSAGEQLIRDKIDTDEQVKIREAFGSLFSFAMFRSVMPLKTHQ
jgi:hypothetical protein